MTNGSGASRRRFSRWPLVLGIVLLGAALWAMFWLRGTLLEGQDTMLEGTVRRFSATEVLGRPESRSINFAGLETLAEASQNNFIRRIYVTKRTETGQELVVHPFHAELTEPAWQERTPWLKLPVGGEEPAGYLYFDIDYSRLHAVNAVIGMLAVLLAGGLGALLIRQRGQQAAIVQMSGELENRKVQVIHLEKLALAGQLSANIFHDIKKPVLNIKHEVSDALDGGETQQQEVLQAVRSQTDLFLQMLHDVGMESFINTTGDDTEWCSIPDIVERSLRLVRYERGDVEVDIRFPEKENFLIQAVPYRLVQVFSNLFLNAFQAMDGAGKLLIEATAKGDRYIINIEDSGPGIPPEKYGELFSPFVTTRAAAGGSGLGLFICRTIVQDLGGTIDAGRGKQLGGARFRVVFPRKSE